MWQLSSKFHHFSVILPLQRIRVRLLDALLSRFPGFWFHLSRELPTFPKLTKKTSHPLEKKTPLWKKNKVEFSCFSFHFHHCIPKKWVFHSFAPLNSSWPLSIRQHLHISCQFHQGSLCLPPPKQCTNTTFPQNYPRFASSFMPPTNGLYNYNYMTPNTQFLATKTPHPLGPCRCCWTAITWSPLKILFSNEDFFPLVLPRKKTCTKLVGDFKFPFEKSVPQIGSFPQSFGVKITRMPRKPQFFSEEFFRTLGLVDLQGFWANCFASETSWCLRFMKCFTVSLCSAPTKNQH